MTDQPPKPNRRWFQFSLRTLLIAVTLVGGLLVAWRVYVEPFSSLFVAAIYAAMCAGLFATIGAMSIKAVSSQRLAEVAITSKLFRQILDRIHRLRTMVPILEPG